MLTSPDYRSQESQLSEAAFCNVAASSEVRRCRIDHAEIVRRFGPALYQLAHQLTCNDNDARDLVQDTFEKSLRKLPWGFSPTSIQSWLLVTLRNRYYDLRRARECRARLSNNDTLLLMATAQDADEEPLWRKVDPAQLWHCVERLNPILRDVFLLRIRERRSHAEIALRLRIPVSTVGTRCFRALKHLRKMLDERHPAAP